MQRVDLIIREIAQSSLPVEISLVSHLHLMSVRIIQLLVQKLTSFKMSWFHHCDVPVLTPVGTRRSTIVPSD